jgi:RecA-family ATPase
VQVNLQDVAAECGTVNTRFAILDASPWQEIEKLQDHELCECNYLSSEEIAALSDEQCEAKDARDRERLQRKHCGRDPDELAEERDFDVSDEPLWFRKLWATDLSRLTTAELEWRRWNKWDLGTPENVPLPDDVEIDGRGSPSERARTLWHRRIHTMTRDEFEVAYAYSKDPYVIAHGLIFEEYDREENAASLRRAPKSELDALRAEFDARQDAARKLSGTELADLITTLTAQEKRAVEARRAKFAEWRRRNEEIEQEKAKQMAQVIPLAKPDPTRGYAALKARDERRAKEKTKEEKPIIWRRVSDLAGKDAPNRRWLIADFVPMWNVTNYTGDGGIGKFLVALQLAVAVALGLKWLGIPVLESGPVIVYSAEDEFDETWRRLEEICREIGIDIGDLDNLHVAPMAGMDAMLSIADERRMMEPTHMWHDLRSKAEAIKPKLVVIDTSADVYGGDENTRQQVKQFVGMLVGLSFDSDCAVMLLSHPSVSGMIDGTGRSGTTGWNNAFRSRLYQDRVLESNPDGPGMIEPDPDLRVLRNNKSNYGRKGKEVRIRWKSGIFVNEDVAEISSADAAIAAERVFLECLALIESQGREVNILKNGSKYAPKLFASLPQAAGYTKHQLGAAMERLLNDRVIRIAQEGSGSRRRDWLTTKPAPEPVSEGPAVTVEADNKLNMAVQFLRARLSNGPVESAMLIAEAKEALISRTTLYRAAGEIGVKSVKDGIYTMLSLS